MDGSGDLYQASVKWAPFGLLALVRFVQVVHEQREMACGWKDVE